MRIIDTYPELLTLCGPDESPQFRIDTPQMQMSTPHIQNEAPRFRIDAWRAYAERISPSLRQLVETDAATYDLQRQVVPVVDDALRQRDKLGMAHQSFLAAVERLPERIREVFGIDMDVDIVFYLGLCNGAGWATMLDGRDAVLLGVEKIVELDWCDEASMRALLYHELSHIWHRLAGAAQVAATPGDKGLLQLYREGFAMYGEQLLCGDPDIFHQDDGQWLPWCRANAAMLKGEYLRRIEAGESVQDFFGDWCRFLDHADVGYFLGNDFVRTLACRYTPEQIARLETDALWREVRVWAAIEG